ncbi:MAG: pyruvate kinase [Lachnospiraceae bacterium]|jgi:pyruvate kinase|nr:pyruvate kinase [Lachnospiraceae bacterium]MCI8872286.1 pyruvate kinase [Lachnospiraceae bacterium]GFI29316.1 pyruvate kinase [Lachnospiraceae bacterium]
MKNLRKTKIICTLGPSTDKGEVLKQLMSEGMNVARFNFSHGTHEEQGERLKQVRNMREELNLPVATLLDTKGPEIRLRDIKDGKTQLEAGQKFTLTTEEILGDKDRVSITYQDLVKDVAPGCRILIDDGLIELGVDEVTDTDIVCHVVNGGMISNKKGVNVPNVELSMPYISEKDYEDILFGIENDFDFVAASFVRTADDVLEIRKIFEEKNCNNINIISKIENMQGVENIDEIIRVSDGIMVARGDMGVEIPLEDVPVIQKMIIKKVIDAGKQVITATQMLDSMMKNPRPTRAEATDVANAIYDGTSAIMLSGETAAGLYPVEALKTMVKIAIRTEQDINYTARFKSRENLSNPDITNAISHATCTTANDLKAAAIITVTQSGKTARMISKYRPDCPIIGGSMYPKVCRQLNLSWGVTPLHVELKDDADELFDHAVDAAQAAGLVSMGDITVITGGVPLGVSGTTNILKVHVAGHILATGTGVNDKIVSANLCVCKNIQDLRRDFKSGDIIVAKETNNEMMEQIRYASGLIVEDGGSNSHAVIAGLSLDIPVITDAEYAVSILKTGAYVTLNAKDGIVSCNQ